MTTQEAIIEIANKLFIYTDQREWGKLQSEVFTETVHFDMSSLGAEVTNKTSQEICNDWNVGFEGVDSINHLAGNYLVSIDGNSAELFCYATATHYKEAATNGKTREFVGTYELGLEQTVNGWRINQFKYNLKYMNGNMDLS